MLLLYYFNFILQASTIPNEEIKEVPITMQLRKVVTNYSHKVM